MRYLASHEKAVRGTFDFPIQLYYIDQTHPRYEMPFHWHMEYELITVLHGTFTLCADGETINLNEGDCALIADDCLHGGTPLDCIYECLVFDLERFMPETGILGKRLADITQSGARLQGKFEKHTNAAAIASELFNVMKEKQRGYEFATTGLLLQLLGIIINKKLYSAEPFEGLAFEKRSEQIKNALRCIRSNYQKRLTLEQLAKKAVMAPKYFCRVFRQITGRTPIDYLNYYRVECAAELLCTTQQSITDIALMCGFNDLSYFNKVFRRHKLVSAREYRAQRTAIEVW